MPIYEYQCDQCGVSFEVLQRMSDDPIETCKECGGSLHKVLHPVAIHFKGSGFYTTDYGKGSGRRPAGREGASEESAAPAADKAETDSGKSADSGSNGSPSASGKSAGGDGKAKEKQKTT